MRRAWRSLRVVALAACALLLAAGAASASPLPTSVLNPPLRAPNGTNAGYVTAPSVVGMFPAAAANGGPLHASSKLHLGPLPGADDGVSVNSLKPCATSEITVLINARAVPKAQRKGNLYINGWFDWGKTGRWTGTGCGVDWAIQNLQVPFSQLDKNGILVLPIKFTAGQQVQELWFRVTVTYDQTAASYRGAPATSFADGESEDYLYRSIDNGRIAVKRAALKPRHGTRAIMTRAAAAFGPGPETPISAPAGVAHPAQSGGRDFNIECVSEPSEVTHNRSVDVSFKVFDSNLAAGPIDGDYSRNEVFSSSWTSKLHKSPNQNGVPKGKVAIDGFNFKSNDKDPNPDGYDKSSTVEKQSVSFFFSRAGSGSQKVKCHFNINHACDTATASKHRKKNTCPPPETAPPAKPPPTENTPAPGGGVTVNPMPILITTTLINGNNVAGTEFHQIFMGGPGGDFGTGVELGPGPPFKPGALLLTPGGGIDTSLGSGTGLFGFSSVPSSEFPLADVISGDQTKVILITTDISGNVRTRTTNLMTGTQSPPVTYPPVSGTHPVLFRISVDPMLGSGNVALLGYDGPGGPKAGNGLIELFHVANDGTTTFTGNKFFPQSGGSSNTLDVENAVWNPVTGSWEVGGVLLTGSNSTFDVFSTDSNFANPSAQTLLTIGDQGVFTDFSDLSVNLDGNTFMFGRANQGSNEFGFVKGLSPSLSPFPWLATLPPGSVSDFNRGFVYNGHIIGVGEQQVGSNTNGVVIEFDPATGGVIGNPLPLVAPSGGDLFINDASLKGNIVTIFGTQATGGSPTGAVESRVQIF